jgi:hypothetical protein
MGKVIELNCVTRLDIPPTRILKAAKKAGLTQVIIIGVDANGMEYFASSVADGGSVLWALERAKITLLEQE